MKIRYFLRRFRGWLTRLFRRTKPKQLSPPVEEPKEQSGVLIQTVRRGRLGAMGIQSTPLQIVSRIPKVGDRVWWAPKQLWCEIRKVDTDSMNFLFIGGEVVRTSDGHNRPRWAVNTGMGGHFFHEPINAWVVGRGEIPKNVRGKIITPDTIKVKLNLSTGETQRI